MDKLNTVNLATHRIDIYFHVYTDIYFHVIIQNINGFIWMGVSKLKHLILISIFLK